MFEHRIFKIQMITSENNKQFELTSNMKEEFANLSSHLRNDIEKVYNLQVKSTYVFSADLIDNEYEEKSLLPE
jgi:hypothetical protein